MFFQNISTRSASCVDNHSSDIVVASSNIDMFNVIYHSHKVILLVCLPQIYVHSSLYITSLITKNA